MPETPRLQEPTASDPAFRNHPRADRSCWVSICSADGPAAMCVLLHGSHGFAEREKAFAEANQGFADHFPARQQTMVLGQHLTHLLPNLFDGLEFLTRK